MERWNQYARVRQDLFQIIDILVLRDGYVLGIQATSGSNHAARVAKIKASPDLAAVLESGMRVEVWSWTKAGARGKRKLWVLRREEIKV